jgi:hypothetical protein
MDCADTVDGLIGYCSENERVCPVPNKWNELFQMINKNHKHGSVSELKIPLILGGWWHSSDADKQARLIHHIEWAAQHDALVAASSFLRGLREEDWHH